MCGPPSLCGSCVQDLEPCVRNEDCCGYAKGDNVCVDTGPGGVGMACLIVCDTNADCQSGCCAHIFGSYEYRVCAPVSACG